MQAGIFGAVLMVALLGGGLAGWGITSAAVGPQLAQSQDALAKAEADYEEVRADLTAEREDKFEVQRENRALKDGVADVEARAAAITDQETAIAAREAELTARDAELTAREQAIKATEEDLASNTDWWIDRVRECLARPGSYRMASATEGTLGREVSCMSG